MEYNFSCIFNFGPVADGRSVVRFAISFLPPPSLFIYLFFCLINIMILGFASVIPHDNVAVGGGEINGGAIIILSEFPRIIC